MLSTVEDWLSAFCLLALDALWASFLFHLSKADFVQRGETPLVLLVSIDAFRYDFLQRPESQTLFKLGMGEGWTVT